MFKFVVFALSISALGVIADDDHGKDVVNLVKDSFDTEVGKKPSFVMFFAPWYVFSISDDKRKNI